METDKRAKEELVEDYTINMVWIKLWWQTLVVKTHTYPTYSKRGERRNIRITRQQGTTLIKDKKKNYYDSIQKMIQFLGGINAQVGD